MPYQSHRDPRVPYALASGSVLANPDDHRIAEAALIEWKEMGNRQAEAQSEAEWLMAESAELARRRRDLEQRYASAWRELGLPYP